MKSKNDERYSYETSSPDRYGVLKENAKQLRKKMTRAECMLWNELRHNRYGLKFRRQHPIDDFIADFVSLPHKLIIEVDGEYHDEADQQEDDNLRTEFLNEKGFKVLRFTNTQVEADVKAVAESIYDAVFSEENL